MSTVQQSAAPRSGAGAVAGIAFLTAVSAVLGLDLFAADADVSSLVAPIAFVAATLVFGVVSLIGALRQPRGRTATPRVSRAAWAYGLPVLYVLLWPVLGLRFYFSTAIVLIVGAYLVGMTRPLWRLVGLIVGVDVLVWLIFAQFLQVPL